MQAIVSVCSDWGIGNKGELLVANPDDMRRFARITCGGRSPAQAAEGETLGVVVMGRKTAESFPGGRPLKARRNIALTRREDWAPEGYELAHDLEELAELLADEDPERVWVVGGEVVYRQLLPQCTRALVTFHDCTRPADSFFPDLDADPDWTLESEEPGGITAEGVEFSYRNYVRA